MEERSSSSAPVLSVVLSARGKEDTILRSVASFMQQEFQAPFEIIVITCAGNGTTERLMHTFPKVRLVESPSRSLPGQVRNLGIEVARGEIVAFLEGDCLARPGWMKNRVKAHRSGHEAVTNAVAVARPKSLASRVDAFLHCGDRLEGTRPGPVREPQSDGLSLTRELLNRVGPFDEALQANEDALLARRLAASGTDVWLEPSVCIERAGPRRMSQLLREETALGRRQARSDLVSVASGALRAKLESRGPKLVLSLRTLRRGADRGWFLAQVLRHAPRRLDVLVALPWIALALVANTLGWARELQAYNRTGGFTNVDDVGPTRAPLRRQTTTTGEKTLMLTFDDGPSEFTPRLLRVLAERDVPATFFVLGARATAMPELIRNIVEAGHDVASHGWSHTDFTELDEETFAFEVDHTRARLCQLTGSDCLDVRPPFGRYDYHSVSHLADRDVVTWLWTADARDYEPQITVGQIVRNALDSLTPGGIVLMHDGGGDRSRTIRALPEIIEGARDRGFRFVALRDIRVSSRPVGRLQP